MSARTVQDQIEALLGRRVAEAKVRGAPSPDAEAVAVFESITLNLLLRPKSMLYVMHLARNGLVKTSSDIITLIDELKSAVSDLGNPSFDVRSTTSLSKARTALLSLEGLDKVSTESGSYRRFNQAVNEFLEKHLSKSVRRPGQSSLIRPGEEASVDLGVLFNQLKELHEEFVDRLHALMVGVENFLESPMGTILGLSTAARARADIEEMIEALEEDPRSVLARDMTVRLIGNRASLKVIGSLPELYGPVLSTSDEVPQGYVLKAASEPAVASKTSLPGPFALPAGAQLQVTLPGLPLTSYLIPQSTFDLSNRAFIVSEQFTDPATYPVTIDPYTYLFISIDRSDGTTYSVRANLNDTASPVLLTFDDVKNAINTALSGVGGCLEFISAGSNRLLVYADTTVGPLTQSRIFIAPSHTEPSASTLGINATFYQTAHQKIGFIMGQSGAQGTTPTFSIVDAINRLFAGQLVATRNPDDSFTLETVTDEIGTFMDLVAPSVLGITGLENAKSNTFRLYGTVFGVETDPVAAQDLVDVGDTFYGVTGSSTISEFNEGKVVLAAALSNFDGPVTINSILAERLQKLDSLLPGFLEIFGRGRFSEDLGDIDAAVAILGSNATPAQRNTVIRLLDELRVQVVQLKGILEDSTTLLPALAATRERELVNGIITTLLERKYDRALSFLLRCKVQELLSMSSDEASFGGTLLKSMSDVARADVEFPNPAADEGEGTSLRIERSGT